MVTERQSGGPRLLVDVRGACDALSVGRTTLNELMRAGELRPVRIGRAVRISVQELEDFIERQRGSEARGE